MNFTDASSTVYANQIDEIYCSVEASQLMPYTNSVYIWLPMVATESRTRGVGLINSQHRIHDIYGAIWGKLW